MGITESGTRLSRRRLIGAALAASAGVLLAACGGAPTPTPVPAKPAEPKPAPPAEPTKPAATPTAAPAAKPAAKATGPAKVTFMSIGGAKEQEMFQAAMKETEKLLADQKITIEWQPDPGGGWEKIMSMFAADQAYDVQRIDDDRVAELALANKIHQLDQWMKDVGMRVDDFYPLFWTTINLGGYQFSLNPLCGVTCLYYNAELFQQAGLPMPPDTWTKAWSWDEFMAIAEKLVKKDARGKPTQYALGFPTNVSTPIAYGAGGAFTNEDETQCMMTDPKVVDAIDKFVQYTKPGGPEWFVPMGVNRRELFNGGKLALIWEAMDFVANISKSIKWDIAPWMKTPKYAMTENYDRTFVISKTAKAPEAAFRVLYQQAVPPVIDVYAKAAFGVPYHKQTAEGPLFLKSDAPPKSKQVWIETMQEIEGRPIYVPTPRSPSMEDNKNTFVDEKLFGAALAGQMTTKEFLEAGCKKADQSIAQHKWRRGEMENRLAQVGALSAKGVKMWPKTPNP